MLGTCAQAQVISLHQVRVDGSSPSTLDPFQDCITFRWFGAPLRLDGARSALLLGEADGQGMLRRRAHGAIAKLSRSRGEAPPPPGVEPDETREDLIVTNGYREWAGRLTRTRNGEILILFHDGLPPANVDLPIVQGGALPDRATARNTICFTPGTDILTEDGPRPVEDLVPGDRVLTRDDGAQDILWVGVQRVSGARLYALPHLRPVRIKSGALGQEEPQPDLLVSPGHQIMLTRPGARALWGEAEVLVRARDLIGDRGVTIEHGLPSVTYVHLLFARHQIVWANRVECESFHPGDADLSHLMDPELGALLDVAPNVDRDPTAYGSHARRCLSQAELAILRHEGAPAYLS